MVRVGIVDDDENQVNKLKLKIEKHFSNINIDLEIFSTCKASEIINLVSSCAKFDYIFLDYDLPEINGYELGKILRKFDKNFKLIYVTSYEDKVFKCIENNVFRYIRKSILDEELDSCLQAIANMHIVNDELNLLTDKGEITISKDNILYIESSNRSIYLGHITGVYELKKTTLKKIFENLNNEQFVYINKGTIINLKNVRKIFKDEVRLINEDKFVISRRRCKDVNNAFLQYRLSI